MMVLRLAAAGRAGMVRLSPSSLSSSMDGAWPAIHSSIPWQQASSQQRAEGSQCYFSSNSNGRNNYPSTAVDDSSLSASSSTKQRPNRSRNSSFQPRRRPPKDYRPFQPKKAFPYKEAFPGNPHTLIDLGPDPSARNDLDRQFGCFMADDVRRLRRDRAILDNDPMGLHDPIEEQLRVADYITTEPGTTEEHIEKRRMMEPLDEKEQKELHDDIDEMMHMAERKWLNFEDNSPYRYLKPAKPRKGEAVKEFLDDDEDDLLYSQDDEDPDSRFDPNAKAHGVWSEYLVNVSRGNHNWRGGRLFSFRAIVVGGNGNGCAGFGVGQGATAMKAMDMAGRESRRNVFFVDRYQQDRITNDLVGRHNSCKVIIRRNKDGLKGNVLVNNILARFGILNASSKAHGRRHPWSVVYATFKAVLTHESLEEISVRRGKRFTTVDKALRMRIL